MKHKEQNKVYHKIIARLIEFTEMKQYASLGYEEQHKSYMQESIAISRTITRYFFISPRYKFNKGVANI